MTESGRDLMGIFMPDPPDYAEREAERAEQRRQDEDRGAGAAFAAFRARVVGRLVPGEGEVLTEGGQTVAGFLAERAGVAELRSSASEMRQLRDVVERHAPHLAHLLPARRMDVLDANMGVVSRDPLQDSADAVFRARQERDERVARDQHRQLLENRGWLARFQQRNPPGEAVRSRTPVIYRDQGEITRVASADGMGQLGDWAGNIVR